MATYSFLSTRRTWLRTDPTYGPHTIDDTDINPLIVAVARLRHDNGGWILNDFRRDGEPAHLDIVVTYDDGYKTSYELKVNGELIAVFNVSKADRPRQGRRIRVRSVAPGAPYYLSENGTKL